MFTVINGVENFETVEKLHSFLGTLIDQGKGSFEVLIHHEDGDTNSYVGTGIVDHEKQHIILG